MTVTPWRDPGEVPMGSDPHGRHTSISPGTRRAHTGAAGWEPVIAGGRKKMHARFVGVSGNHYCFRNGQSADLKSGGDAPPIAPRPGDMTCSVFLLCPVVFEGDCTSPVSVRILVPAELVSRGKEDHSIRLVDVSIQ